MRHNCVLLRTAKFARTSRHLGPTAWRYCEVGPVFRPRIANSFGSWAWRNEITPASYDSSGRRMWPQSRNGRQSPMSELEDLEQRIRKLPPEELAKFRVWFVEFDHLMWDRQIEADARAGKLDWLAANEISNKNTYREI